jgi:hypothetical protein
MNMRKNMKSFTSLLDYSSEELEAILHRADKLKDLWYKNDMPQSLKIDGSRCGFTGRVSGTGLLSRSEPELWAPMSVIFPGNWALTNRWKI